MVPDERESSRSRLSCEPTTSQPNSPRLTSICHNSLPGSSALLQTSMSGGDGAGKVKACTGQGNGSCSGDPGSVPYNLQDHDPISNRRKRSRMHYYNINGCLECEVKDAEIKTLRRRIQVMEEVVGLLNQKLSALQQSSNGVLFSPMVMPPVVSQVVIPTSYSTPPTTSIKVGDQKSSKYVLKTYYSLIVSMVSSLPNFTEVTLPVGAYTSCYCGE